MEIDKEVVEKMIETTSKANIDFRLNAALATPISKRIYRHITHLSVDESEAAIISGRDRNEVNEGTWSITAQEFLERGVQDVVATLSVKSAFYANSEEDDRCLAFDADVVHNTGAGGVCCFDLRQKANGQWDIRSAVVRSNKAAAMTIQAIGVQAGIPWGDELDNFDAPHMHPRLPRSVSTPSMIPRIYW
ncbi:Ribokinase-like protein [Xylaria castorea]|nr:Ribokinase-like protein [Xylaria castorea]